MNVLDLFSGIGGFSLGLERAGMRTVAFCEIDKKCHLVLKKHWPDTPVYTDIKSLRGEMISDQVDVICGGFPCQDISLAGKGAGLTGERSGLWWEFHRLIKEIKPRYAVIENVSALRSRGLDVVLRSLAEIGYDAQWHCIPASAIGANHQRDRIWIIAYPHRERLSDGGKEVANANRERRDGWRNYRKERCVLHDQNGNPSQNESEWKRWVGGSCADGKVFSNPNCAMPQRQWDLYERVKQELTDPRYASGWAAEPAVGRVANGISRRVDRLRQLGNSVVPQIPEIIGRAIMKETQYEQNNQSKISGQIINELRFRRRKFYSG